ncbi:MAG: tryptophan synthase subunit alpha [Phycisphaerales bacterium]|nr:tryptophan synthase subunit alpha [Phycisphaerales bacterium]
MNRVESIFSSLKQDGKKAIMPFLVAGHPTLTDTAEAIKCMSEQGADVIEIGIPFSDPIADGPVISAAMHEVLQSGITPSNVMKMVQNIRAEVSAALIAMVSFSIVKKSGSTSFIEALKKSGFDGVIIPDIDVQEAKELSCYCKSIGLTFTMLIAPTTTDQRIEELASISSGFLYLLARVGITGEQSELPDLEDRIAKLRNVTDLPIAVGFGISTREQVSQVHQHADAVIVGSALVRRMSESESPAETAKHFVHEIS